MSFSGGVFWTVIKKRKPRLSKNEFLIPSVLLRLMGSCSCFRRRRVLSFIWSFPFSATNKYAGIIITKSIIPNHDIPENNCIYYYLGVTLILNIFLNLQLLILHFLFLLILLQFAIFYFLDNLL